MESGFSPVGTGEMGPAGEAGARDGSHIIEQRVV